MQTLKENTRRAYQTGYRSQKTALDQTGKDETGVTCNPCAVRLSKRYIRGMYQAATYYAKQNPYRVNQGKVRRDMLQLEKLREDCRYILRQDIKSMEDVAEREKELRALEKFLKGQRGESMILKEDIVYQQYQALSEEASRLPDWDDRFENLLDQMEELEESLPQDFWKFRKMRRRLKNS